MISVGHEHLIGRNQFASRYLFERLEIISSAHLLPGHCPMDSCEWMMKLVPAGNGSERSPTWCLVAVGGVPISTVYQPNF
ncbi:unnamed protein product [Nesidiocoris tenuis]|uniref:Uncharacterized protein n=1 Tax=Nesidiocoris tenuis TaxID=355587 RepID=A0A6H5HGZ1_9HEMI|nr:unnamed protein product [Nesidiocoris tenuis]